MGEALLAVLPGKGQNRESGDPLIRLSIFSVPLHCGLRDRMTKKCPWRGLLIGVLVVVFAMPARADKLQTEGDEIVIAIVVVAVGVVVGTILIIHYSKKRSITRRVMPASAGMILTDEKDKHTYALSGITTGVKQGNRMKLQGKRLKPKGTDTALVWETKDVAKDYGACTP
jgi:hypothetical protein